jgi:hypothetical protein
VAATSVIGTTLLPASAAAAPAVASAAHCVAALDTHRVACASDEKTALRLATPSAAATSVVVARFYDGTNYSGSSTPVYAPRACTASYDAEWQYADFRDFGWNDRVSSVKTYNHCDVKFYKDINFGGGSSTWIDASANLSAIGTGWNNVASSAKLS